MKQKHSHIIDWEKFHFLLIPAWNQSTRQSKVNYKFDKGVHQYHSHFPLDAFGGEVEITIQVQELESEKFKISYCQENKGETNSLLKKIEGELILKDDNQNCLTFLHPYDNRQKVWVLSKSKDLK